MRKGFTLTEVLISLMVITIIAAASVPVMTHRMIRKQAALTRPWNWVGNNGVFNPQSGSLAVIGTNNIPEENAPVLTINTSSNNMEPIAFYNNGLKSGSLIVNDKGCILGNHRVYPQLYEGNDIPEVVGNIESHDTNAGKVYSNAVSLGNISDVSTNSVVIGNGASASGNSVAVGYLANAYGPNSIGIGADSYANDYAIAIGSQAKSQSANSIAIGAGANAVSEYSMAIGRGTIASNDCYVIGKDSNVATQNAILIVLDTDVVTPYHGGFTNGVYNGYDAMLYTANTLTLGSWWVSVILRGDAYVANELFVGTLIANEINYVEYSWVSDSRLKNIGEENKSGIDKLSKLKIYNYTFKNNPKDKRVGVIAQELMKVFPDAISKNNKGYYKVREEDIFFSMVNALKEFDLKVKNITEKISNLNKISVSLETKIKKLSKQTEKNTNDIEKLKKDIDSIEVKLRNNS